MEFIAGRHVSFALHRADFPEAHYATATLMAAADPTGGSE